MTPPGWYSDPLGRFPLRYWDGWAWSSYGWSGAVVVDPLGIAPTPPWPVRLRGAFRFSKTSLALLVLFLIACTVVTILGASPSQLGNDAAAWLFVPLLFLAQLSDRAKWLGWIVMGFGGVAAVTLLAVAAGSLLVPQGSPAAAAIWGTGGIALGVVLVPYVRRRIARLIPIDPDRVAHTVALQLAVLLLVVWASSQVGNAGLNASSYGSSGLLDIPLSELPLLVGGFFGVGIFIRRNFAESVKRLGLIRPSVAQVVVALLLAQLFSLVAVGADYLTSWLTPQTSTQLGQVSQAIYGSFGSDILPWILIAASAGIAEEVLFRGAIQPRLGLLATSLLFTATHVQYGISIVLALILLLALSLGLLRKAANTTTAVVCHVAYDLLAGLPFPWWWLLVALGIQLPIVIFFAIRHRAALKRSLSRLLHRRAQSPPALTPLPDLA